MKEKKHKKSANLVHKFAVKTLDKGVRGLNILVVMYMYDRADKLNIYQDRSHEAPEKTLGDTEET